MDMRDVVCGKTRVLLGLAFRRPSAESAKTSLEGCKRAKRTMKKAKSRMKRMRAVSIPK